MREKLTVLIPTYNCEDIIKECLLSVKDIADEILIVDSFSTDKTLNTCKHFNMQTCKQTTNNKIKIIQRKYGYSASQKNWAIPQAENNWVLLIDSDERLTPKLRSEIKSILNKQSLLKKVSGFEIARRHYFLGKWLRFGGRYPLYNVRLFKKTCCYEDRNVHAHILLPKHEMRKLKNDIIHESDRNLEQILEKINRYSTYQVRYMTKIASRGIKVDWKEFFTNYLAFKAVVKDVWFFIPFSPLWRFLYMYCAQFGFLDGREGLLIAVLYGFEDFVSKNKYKKYRTNQHECRTDAHESRIRRHDLSLNPSPIQEEGSYSAKLG
ncbi:glycosyltransferase family 2 protein [bacterium]|nr:MAG: glycosyltransferase family 2 protein [bacterium]